MNNPKKRIFSRLKRATAHGDFNIPDYEIIDTPNISRSEKVKMLKQRMEAVRSEVYIIKADQLADTLKETARRKNLKNILYSPNTPVGQAIQKKWNDDDLPQLLAYDKDVEAFKNDLFYNIDAGLTTAKGGIADTGAIILWPDESEPRLMSLVPPVHIAVLKASDIYACFSEAVEKWPEQMPTNALLISGPSKTADIELILVFGVHGPKELVVIIIDN